MNIGKLEELRAQLVAETKRKQKAMEDMDTADSTRMKAEAVCARASEAIYSIRNEIMDCLMGEQA
jgi:hypothetical protein